MFWKHFRITSVCLANRFFFLASTMISKQRKRKVSKQIKLKVAKSASSTYFDFFDSTVISDDSEWNIFSEFTDILQRLQQLQFLYRKSNLLDLLHDCLMSFALNWFKNQSKFISLHDFDIAFTKAFFPNEFATNSTISRKQHEFEDSISDCCQWCQLVYEIWNSHRLQYFSCDVQNQQAYEFVLQFLEEYTNEIVEQQKANALKIEKKTKINAVKNVKRVESKALKTKEATKSTSTFHDIDIFDSIFTCDDRRFSESEEFLQHFQQCQHQYRKSNLLTLLFVCFWNSAFDIWFDRQTIMKSASLSEWIEILRVDFANVSFVKIKISKVICMRCDSNFNFKNKFRNHVRNQHAKKSINSSNFMINTVKSACEIVEKSAVICLLDSFVLQKSLVFLATSRKHVSKFEITFETINSSTSSILSIATVSNALQSMKNESVQCFFASWIFISTFESKNQKILVRKFATSRQISESASISESVISSECLSLSSFTLEYISKSTESAFIQRFFDSSKLQIPIATSKQIFESTLIFETVVSSKISHLSFSASETVSESMKNTSIQCSFISSRSSSSQTFESEFQEISVWKFSEFCSSLSIDTVKSVCEIEKNSTVIETFVLQVFEIASSKSSSLQTETFKVICETMKKSTVIVSSASSVSQKSDISTAISKHKFEFVMIFETVTSSENSHFSFIASETVSEQMKNESNQCSFAQMFSFFRTFEINHQEICVSKFSRFCSFLTSLTLNLVCETQKNSAVIIFKKSCFICRIDVSSVKKHYFESSSCHEALRHRLEQQLARRAHQRKQKAQKQVELIEQNAQKQTEIEKVIDQLVKNFHLSINAINFVCEIEKTTESAKRSATCRRCNQIFNFNNKFHEHIRQCHARKLVKNFDFRVSTLESAYKIAEKSTIFCSFVSFALLASFVSQKFSISFATSRSQKFWFEIVFESIVASTHSDLSIATYKISSKSMKNAIVNRSLIFSFISSHTSVRKHQEFHIQKFYLIMNDLHRMFHEKSESFSLRQHHNRRFSQQNFDIRQYFSIKSHFIIDDLIRMFHEKSRSFDLRQHHNHRSFSQNIDARSFVTYQSRITIYFLLTINQKASIDQNLKSSNSKSLNQHMSAKSIRIAFSEILSEKSIKLLYKLSDVFCINFKFQIETHFFISILFRLFSTFLIAFAFVSIMFVAKMSCISVYQQVISIIDRVNIELVASRRNWKETRNRMLEYSVTKHFHKRCFVYTFYWMNCTHRLSHAFKYRCVNRCYTNSANTVKLFVSWYNRFMIFKNFQERWRVCLLMIVETTRKRLYELIIFQKIHYIHALLNAMYTSIFAYE